ncbi:MAG: NAD(P)H-dependent oxidoreductase [Flavobacterium sp.]|uniref:NAD(P)H-dependent oxidoreductase n=1 Tax=Flavobacterium sp. TaxID=239 RepID=UPI0012203691|nr:NAD(P)H-dependent oxidoreductase [Flavobacterium sp.]RZJ65715.1 MAG: NAD(P)H-dependent oxidoreductase [Flavobacterium sp.]
MNTFISNLNWRYATKKYDASRKISADELDILKQAIRFSPSSMGLQPYKVLIIEDRQIREQLAEASFTNKDSILNASHLFVFANIVDFGKTDVDDFIGNLGQVRGIPVENLEEMRTKVNSYVGSRDASINNIWTSKQTYIALANLLNAAASLEIDATPMEGFQADKYNEILGLIEKGLSASVIATVGYRLEDDSFQHLKKVRKPENELFITL